MLCFIIIYLYFKPHRMALWTALFLIKRFPARPPFQCISHSRNSKPTRRDTGWHRVPLGSTCWGRLVPSRDWFDSLFRTRFPAIYFSLSRLRDRSRRPILWQGSVSSSLREKPCGPDLGWFGSGTARAMRNGVRDRPTGPTSSDPLRLSSG